jgi:hypothetical protein
MPGPPLELLSGATSGLESGLPFVGLHSNPGILLFGLIYCT